MDKSCVTFLLCDPGWYVHKPDVQNKRDDNTHIQYIENMYFLVWVASTVGFKRSAYVYI